MSKRSSRSDTTWGTPWCALAGVGRRARCAWIQPAVDGTYSALPPEDSTPLPTPTPEPNPPGRAELPEDQEFAVGPRLAIQTADGQIITMLGDGTNVVPLTDPGEGRVNAAPRWSDDALRHFVPYMTFELMRAAPGLTLPPFVAIATFGSCSESSGTMRPFSCWTAAIGFCSSCATPAWE